LGEVRFSVGGTARKAIDYVLHVELGGLTGIIAPMIGKQPPNYHIWILGGTAPAFIREEGPLYERWAYLANRTNQPLVLPLILCSSAHSIEQPRAVEELLDTLSAYGEVGHRVWL
jgi:hypothetical protein